MASTPTHSTTNLRGSAPSSTPHEQKQGEGEGEGKGGGVGVEVQRKNAGGDDKVGWSEGDRDDENAQMARMLQRWPLLLG